MNCKDNRRRSHKVSFFSFAGILVVLGMYWTIKTCVYVVFIPPWQAPDEPTHFEYVSVAAQSDIFFSQKKPDFELQKAVIQSMDDFDFWKLTGRRKPDNLPETFYQTPLIHERPTQFTKPPLYYMISGLLVRFFSSLSMLNKMYLLRTQSLIFGLISLVFMFMTFRKIFPDERTNLLPLISLPLFLPQFSFISASVSNDSLLVMLSSCFFLFLTCVIKGEKKPLFSVLLVLSFLSIILVKRSGFVFLPVLAAAAAFGAVKIRSLTQSKYAYLIIGMTLMLCFILWTLLGWFFPSVFRKAIMEISLQLKNLFAATSSGPSRHAFSNILFFRVLFESFFLKFGWMYYSAPDYWYGTWYCVYIVGASLSFVYLLKKDINVLKNNIPVFILFAFSFLLFIAAIFLMYGCNSILAQGRYIFPVLTPVSILAGSGAVVLCRRRSGRITVILCVAILFLLDVSSVWRILIPAFYGSP